MYGSVVGIVEDGDTDDDPGGLVAGADVAGEVVDEPGVVVVAEPGVVVVAEPGVVVGEPVVVGTGAVVVGTVKAGSVVAAGLVASG